MEVSRKKFKKKQVSNVGGNQNVMSKAEKKEDEKKTEVKLKGDFGYNCNYCNGHNQMAKDCMLGKMEEKKEKVKYEAYYAKRLEEVCAQTKNLSLMAKGGDEIDGIYQIWSFGSDDEEMHHPTHGVLFAKYKEGESCEKSLVEKGMEDSDEELEEYVKVDEESDEKDYETNGRCFVLMTPKAPMTAKVRDLLISFNIFL